MQYYRDIGPTPETLRKLSAIDPLAAADWDGEVASINIDYLANGGAELEKATKKDPITVTRLADALQGRICHQNSLQ